MHRIELHRRRCRSRADSPATKPDGCAFVALRDGLEAVPSAQLVGEFLGSWTVKSVDDVPAERAVDEMLALGNGTFFGSAGHGD